MPRLACPRSRFQNGTHPEPRGLTDAGGVELEDGGESLLGDVDAADAFHAAFAGLLGFREFLIAGDIAAAGFG